MLLAGQEDAMNARIKAGLLLLLGDMRCHTTEREDECLKPAMATRLDKLCGRVFCFEDGGLPSQQPQAS